MAGAMDVRWGSTYSMPTVRQPLASYEKKKSTGGIFGHLEEITGNLLGDIKDAAVGIPMGLVNLAEHPIRSIEAMGKAEWATYSPLFHGHVGEFLHGLEEHPLQPILDIATIVTLGGAAAGTISGSAARGLAAAGKVGAAEKFAGVAGKTVVKDATGVSRVVARDPINLIKSSKLLRGSGVPENRVAYKHLSGNPVTRFRQTTVMKAMDKIAENAPRSSATMQAGKLELTGAARFVGEGARYRKALGHVEADRRIATHQLQMTALKEAIKVKGMTGAQIWEKLKPHFDNSMNRHEMSISPRQMRQKADGSLGLAEGYQFRRDPSLPREEPYVPKDASPEEIAKAIDRWKRDEFTNDIAEAKRNADGTFAVARSADKMAQEAKNGYRAIHAIHSKPMQVWKWMVLAASPRFFINNVVGNTLMYVMATNPKASIEGIIHSAHQAFGERRALAELNGLARMERKLRGGPIRQGWEFQTKGLSGHELEDLAGTNLEKQAKAVSKLTTKRGKTKAALKGGLYPITHKVSDEWVRTATINYAAKRTGAYQLEYQQLRANGVGYFKAHEAALQKVIDDPGAHHFVTNAVNNVLGDYNYLSRTERAVKNVVPFYTWDRAIMRHTKEMAMNRPYEALMLAGIGKQGVEETQKALGKVPEFLKGAIPVGSHTDGILGWIFGVGVGGRTRILTTQGLNPYATVPDITSAIGALGGVGKLSAGETVGSQISPFLAGAVESLTGSSLLSGAPIDHARGGMIGDIIANTGGSVPQYRLLKAMLSGANPGDAEHPKLFTSDTRQQLSSYLGLPTKDISKAAMKNIYARENPRNRKYAKRDFTQMYDSPSMPRL